MTEKRSRTILKRAFGVHANEGQRQLWIVMLDRDWTQAELAERIGCDSGLVNRWLYAFGKPGLKFLPKVRDELNIEIDAFSTAPTGPWPLDELQRLASAAAPGPETA